MPGGIIVIIVLGVALVATIAVLGYLREKKRREAFQALAARMGLRFSPDRDHQLPRHFRFLDKLRQGSNRYAFNVLDGDYEGHYVQAFDFHYETHSTNSKGHRQTHHHHFSFFILELPRRFPELRIYPEGLLSKFGQMVGFDDIDFESVAFSRAFCVRSTDKKFAYDICHARMMEYLLGDPKLSLEIEDAYLALSFDRRLDVQEVPGRLRQLVEIRNLFPDYLLRG
ncbi:MAG: hypothetical protein ACODAJ_01875 [Planctomycetota bacterium]